MNPALEARLRDLLEREPTRAIPMESLHRLLAAEVGPGPSGYGRLHRAVTARPDAFILLEPASPLGDGLTKELRSAYATALEAARFAPAARVALAVHEQRGSRSKAGGVQRVACTLTPPPAAEDDDLSDAARTVAALETSLLVLWRNAAADAELRGEVTSAFTHVDDLRRRLGLS